MPMNRAEQKVRREAAVAELLHGESIATVSAKYGLSLSTVYTWALSYNIPRRGAKYASRTLAVLKDIVDGMRPKEIAAKHGITRQRVANIAWDARRSGWDV